MKLRRRQGATSEAPPGGYVGDHADKLRRIPRLPVDEDERPSREDLSYGTNIFNRSPVPLPRLLTGRKRQH